MGWQREGTLILNPNFQRRPVWKTGEEAVSDGISSGRVEIRYVVRLTRAVCQLGPSPARSPSSEDRAGIAALARIAGAYIFLPVRMQHYAEIKLAFTTDLAAEKVTEFITAQGPRLLRAALSSRGEAVILLWRPVCNRSNIGPVTNRSPRLTRRGCDFFRFPLDS